MNIKHQHEFLAICRRARMIGLYGFILFLPISISFSQMSLGLLLLAYIGEGLLTKRFPFPKTPLNFPLLAYLAITLIVTIVSVNFLRSVNELRDLLFKIVVFYLFYLYIQDKSQLKKFTVLLVFAVTVAAAYGIVQHYLEVDLFRLSKPFTLLKHVDDDLKAPVRISGFSSYMTFSGQLAMTLPIIWALAFAVKRRIKKIFVAIAILLICLAWLWTYTRGAWVAAACALIWFVYERVKRLSFVLIPLLLLLLFVSFQPAMLERIVSIFQAKENLERLYTWESTLHIIRDYPLFGIGKGNYSKLAPKYRTEYDFDFTSRAHAHNSILQVMVEGGIFSLLAFLWLWVVIFREMTRTYQQIPEKNVMGKILSLGFLCAIIAFFIQGFFEHNFGDSESVMMMWLITAFSLRLQSLGV